MRILRKACERVGIEGASSHSFRRTALTQMSDNNIPIRVIAEVSGHRNLSQLQVYLDVRPIKCWELCLPYPCYRQCFVTLQMTAKWYYTTLHKQRHRSSYKTKEIPSCDPLILHNDRISALNPDSLILTRKMPMCQLQLIDKNSYLIAEKQVQDQEVRFRSYYEFKVA
jgi:hypothetical protein